MSTYLTPGGLVGQACRNCHERPAAVWFLVGPRDLIHGGAEPWCELCVVRAQLDNARALAAMIPRLEAREVELLAQEIRATP